MLIIQNQGDVVVAVGVTTVNLTGALVTPHMAAVISVFPTALHVANPPIDMVAISVLELAQIARNVKSATEPSEYFPIANNWVVEPGTKLAGGAGAKAMEVKVGVGVGGSVCIGILVDVDEQDATNKVRVAINPKAKP